MFIWRILIDERGGTLAITRKPLNLSNFFCVVVMTLFTPTIKSKWSGFTFAKIFSIKFKNFFTIRTLSMCSTIVRISKRTWMTFLQLYNTSRTILKGV